MTPERQRIAIAEICGYQRLDPPKPLISSKFGLVGYAQWKKPDGHLLSELEPIPDCLVDLNAMREVLTTLGERERKVFECILAAIVGGFEIEDFTDPSSYIGWFEAPAGTVFTLLISSASQQAEAFLRAKGRWEDSLTPSPT